MIIFKFHGFRLFGYYSHELRNIGGSILEEVNLSGPEDDNASLMDIDDLLYQKDSWQEDSTGSKTRLLQDWLL